MSPELLKTNRSLRRASLGQERQISSAIRIAEKHWQPPIAALRDVVRD